MAGGGGKKKTWLQGVEQDITNWVGREAPKVTPSGRAARLLGGRHVMRAFQGKNPKIPKKRKAAKRGGAKR